MLTIRRQLTLFVDSEAIELIRFKFNRQQFDLIAAHVTLCREDEIENLEAVLENLKDLKFQQHLSLKFRLPERFDDGKGVYMPSAENNPEFDALRKVILCGITENPRKHLPHITLMHPRNSACTDIIFNEIRNIHLPLEMKFDKVSLIEQRHDSAWCIVEEFFMG